MIKEICTLLGIDDKSTEFFEKACKKIFDSAEAAECFELAKNRCLTGRGRLRNISGK